MDFDIEKKNALNRKDYSEKGKIDSDIRELVDLINSNINYYTTSSCSGRIVLIAKKDGKKGCNWLYKTHTRAEYEKIRDTLEKIPKEDIWLKQESMIMHVCCRAMEDAKKLLIAAQTICKRTGIITMSRRIIVEIFGTEYMDTIVARDEKILITDEYLKILVHEANKKLEQNKKNIKILSQLLKRLI